MRGESPLPKMIYTREEKGSLTSSESEENRRARISNCGAMFCIDGLRRLRKWSTNASLGQNEYKTKQQHNETGPHVSHEPPRPQIQRKRGFGDHLTPNVREPPDGETYEQPFQASSPIASAADSTVGSRRRLDNLTSVPLGVFIATTSNAAAYRATAIAVGLMIDAHLEMIVCVYVSATVSWGGWK